MNDRVAPRVSANNLKLQLASVRRMRIYAIIIPAVATRDCRARPHLPRFFFPPLLPADM